MNNRLLVVAVLYSLLLSLCAASPNSVLFVYNTAPKNTYPAYSEDEVKFRLTNLSCLINPVINDDVLEQIKKYTTSSRRSSEIILKRKDYYFPIFERLLSEHDLPTELKYLAVIESSLRPGVVSHAGAGGIWQMIVGTATRFGLTVDKHVDQRFDPVQSTEAAILYIKKLYSIFGDWHLVFAAYNCGENRILDAMAKSGSKDYWTIRHYLPKETQQYVPAFIGATYMMTYYQDHGLIPQEETDYSTKFSFAKVNQKISFQQIKQVTGLDIETIRELNPAFKKDIIPQSKEGNYLVLPDSQMTVLYQDYFYAEYEKALASDKQIGPTEQLLPEIISFNRPLISDFETITLLAQDNIETKLDNLSRHSVEVSNSIIAKQQADWNYHIIQRRESIQDIVYKYKSVNIEDVKSWNNLTEDVKLVPGSVLRIRK